MATVKYILIATVILNLSTVKSFGNALADQKASQIIGDNNWVSDNSAQNQANSRESNALDAQSQGKTGAGMAIAAGVSMIATGVPMIMTLDPYLIAAGSQLISQGGMEIAQGAANAEGANYNGSQRQTLNSVQPNTISPVSTEQQQQVQEAMNSPEFNRLLNDSGVEPNQFKQKLINGDFKTGNDVLSALGKDIDPEIMKEGEKIANEKATSILASIPGGPNFRPDEKNTTSGDTSKSALSGAKSGPEDTGLSQKVDGGFRTADLSKDIAHGDIAKSKSQTITPSAVDSVSSFLNRMFGANSVLDPNDQKALLRQEALAMGIQMPVKGVSIFAIAHRKYNEFSKARKSPSKVAMR